MSSGRDIPDFPDLEAKLSKPSKQSAYEKQKAEALAKREREAAETAAVLRDFVESFDDDNGGYDGARGRGGNNGPGFAPSQQQQDSRSRPSLGVAPGGNAPGGASRRHFGAPTLKSGPGSLGPAPGGFAKKRSFNDFARGGDRRSSGLDTHGPPRSVNKAFGHSDDEEVDEKLDREEEKARARPTLRLINLPPGTSPTTIKGLMPSSLKVEDVKMESLSGSSGNGYQRRSSVAVVILSQETPANDIEAVVSLLQNRYLGYGYYMSLHRHLSSAVSTAAISAGLSAGSDSQPFGAKPVDMPSTTKRPVNSNFQRGYAPPTTYNHSLGGVSRANILHVPVKPPQDVKMLRLISRVIEGILEHGVEFEALLMSRPEVQKEGKWSWIWDARSEGGIWYRWRLWEVITGGPDVKSKAKYIPLFDDSHAWKLPEKRLPFEYTTRLDEFVSDPEYDSSDDEDLEGEEKGADEEKTFLNPLDEAKLTHLLARLPTSISKLRKGDVARVTAFAIAHASKGVDEVVSMIVSNLEKPFALTGANSQYNKDHQDTQKNGNPDEISSGEGADLSAARLVGLYVISDILSCSSTSGVRHAWRFRQIFEGILTDRNIFETLGLMAEKHSWGRLRAEKWKRSVKLVLNLWEGWCAFPAESQELFTKSFENPPALHASEETTGRGEDAAKKHKWKTVEATTGSGTPDKGRVAPPDDDDALGQPMDEDDAGGEPIDEDDVEGEPIDDDDVGGEPIHDDDLEDDDVMGEPMEEDDVPNNESESKPRLSGEGEPSSDQVATTETTQPAARRKRMRAADMFADSDGSQGD